MPKNTGRQPNHQLNHPRPDNPGPQSRQHNRQALIIPQNRLPHAIKKPNGGFRLRAYGVRLVAQALPKTGTMAPFMTPASSVRRKSATPAISSGVGQST